MINFKRILICFLFVVFSVSFSQEIIVKGVVKDSNGLIIVGANVNIKETKISTCTDFYGSYSFKSKIGDILVFSWIGCESVEIKITNSEKINIVLKESEFVFCTFGVTSENYDEWQSNYRKDEKSYPIAIDKTINFDLENNFKNDIVNKSLKIYVFENKTNTISQNEFNFQNKYKLTFTTFYKINNDYYENYNKKAFDYLEDNFNDKWQNEINFDVLGFEKWQNN